MVVIALVAKGDSSHPDLSVSRQCELLDLPRFTLYYRPTSVRKSTLAVMARIDALDLEDPCSGSHLLVDYLAREGIPISRDRVRSLMRCTGLRSNYQKPQTTVLSEPSDRLPCFVDLNPIKSIDQVWAKDITCIYFIAESFSISGGDRGPFLQAGTQLEAVKQS
ncbi:MAG: hypothetical protein NTZ53_07375 [Cyanobacteria bacterium]|nr:hypothetical protein [Cyanobacteriota bacterium]